MDKQIQVEGKQVLVKLHGYMLEENAVLLGQELSGYVCRGFNTFVIDMSKLDYIDSSGLGVLIALNKVSIKSGGSVSLCGLQGTVEELFEVTHLKKVFKVMN